VLSKSKKIVEASYLPKHSAPGSGPRLEIPPFQGLAMPMQVSKGSTAYAGNSEFKIKDPGRDQLQYPHARVTFG
jgi:hypothetical protein